MNDLKMCIFLDREIGFHISLAKWLSNAVVVSLTHTGIAVATVK